MKPYKKMTPDPPSRRAITILILITAALLLANVAHQAGIA